jgi:hypothetical protein
MTSTQTAAATKTPLLPADATNDCPVCKTGRLERFITYNRADNPEAEIVETMGASKGKRFHECADCDTCGAFYEVAK